MKVTNLQLREIIRRDGDRAAMANYMRGLGYDAIMDIEALMMYGQEITLYGDGAESLAMCIDDVQASWGGDKGNPETAISYMVAKEAFTDYLTAAIDAL